VTGETKNQDPTLYWSYDESTKGSFLSGYLAGWCVCARKFMYLLVNENVPGSFETPSC
jgi:hypothetical protein